MHNNDKNKPTILQVLSVDNPEGNGVYAAVMEYIKHEGKIANVGLLDIKGKTNKTSNVFWLKDYSTLSAMIDCWRRPDIIIFNEVYVKEYISLYKECIKLGIPYIIIPHGCLTVEAQKRKKYKKLLANSIIFNKFINHAAAVQFLNNYEKTSSKKIKTKIIIDGNGIEKIQNNPFPTNTFVTYIGRYSISHKGLDILFSAIKLKSVFLRKNNIVINLYGRESVNTISDVKKLAKNMGIDDIVAINGPIYGADKEKILKKTSLFIQTSRYEGQPMGIVEALSYGIPCLVSYETSFGDIINNYNSGAGVNLNPSTISEALENLLTNKKTLKTMSNNAKRLVSDNYIWNNIAASTVRDYESIIGEKNGF